MANVEKWIYISLHGLSKTGVTKVWRVTNKREGKCIGEIRWYGANGFRGYCFFPTIEPDTAWMLFSADCMRFIADFCDDANAKHRGSRMK